MAGTVTIRIMKIIINNSHVRKRHLKDIRQIVRHPSSRPEE